MPTSETAVTVCRACCADSTEIHHQSDRAPRLGSSAYTPHLHLYHHPTLPLIHIYATRCLRGTGMILVISIFLLEMYSHFTSKSRIMVVTYSKGPDGNGHALISWRSAYRRRGTVSWLYLQPQVDILVNLLTINSFICKTLSALSSVGWINILTSPTV